MELTMIILAVFGLCALIYAIVLQIKVSEQKKSINDMDKLNQQRMKEAQEQIAIQKKEALLFAKETLHEQREEFEREIKSRRNEIIKLEDKLAQREDKIESKIQELTDKEEAYNKKIFPTFRQMAEGGEFIIIHRTGSRSGCRQER